MRISFLLSRVLGFTAVLSVGTAYAGFTNVDGPSGGSEPTQAQILSELYGGTFAGDGDSYSNGDLTALRIPDFDAPATDQTWKPGRYTVRSVAKFTSEAARFYASSPVEPQVHANVFGYNSGAPITIQTTDDFHWKAIDYYGSSSSDVSFNSDNKDHFVTYEILGDGSPSNTSKFVMFWEDLPQTRNVTNTKASWSDFNDLVVEVQAVASNGAVIPLPPAVYAGGATMALIAAGSFLRNRQRRAH